MTMQSSGEEPSNSASISLEAASNKRKVWIRTLKTVGFAAVIYFFVFPLVPGFRQAFSDLFEVDKTMLVLGVLLEFIGLFCYSLNVNWLRLSHSRNTKLATFYFARF